MASKIIVDQIESSGSNITIPTGTGLVVTDGIAATNLSGTIADARLPTVPVTKGGTGLTSLGSAGQAVKVNSAGNGLEFGAVGGGGKILQVVSTTTNAMTSHSRSNEMTNFLTQITPATTGSKILVIVSLGMVGALSIVRFRNPVRSPLELSTYFGAITMGIAASVSLKWLIFLIVSISFAVFAMILMDYLSNKILKKPLFIASFSEGNSLSTLTIQLSESMDILEKNLMLQSKVSSGGTITYTLASPDFNKLKKLVREQSC